MSRITISKQAEQVLAKHKRKGECNRDALDRLFLEFGFVLEKEQQQAAENAPAPFDDSLPAGWSWSNHMTLIALAKHQLDLVWDGVQVAIPFEGEIQ